MPEKLYTAIAKCQHCGRELNRAEHVPEKDRARVAMTVPLAGLCPIRDHNTFSDINFGAELEWIEENPTAASSPPSQ